MKAVILALEANHEGKQPLALCPLLGRSLLERALANVATIDVEEAILLTRLEDEAVREKADQWAVRHNITLTHQHVGHDVTAGAALVALGDDLGASPWLMLNVAYACDPGVISALVDAYEDEVVIAADRQTMQKNTEGMWHADVQDGLVRSLQADLPTFNAYVPLVMICPPTFLDKLSDTATANSPASLIKALHHCIRDDVLHAVDINGRLWCFVNSYQTLRDAEAAVYQRIRHSTKDSVLKRHVLRPLSTRLSAAFVTSNISVNMMSVIMLVLSCVAALLFSLSGYGGLLLGGVIAFVALLMQVATQEVALIRQNQVLYDRWLGHMLTKYSEVILLAGLTVHAAHLAHLHMVFVGCLAIVGSLMLNYSVNSYRHLQGQPPAKEQDILVKRDIRMIAIIGGALLNLPSLVLLLLAVLLNVVVVRRIVTW